MAVSVAPVYRQKINNGRRKLWEAMAILVSCTSLLVSSGTAIWAVGKLRQIADPTDHVREQTDKLGNELRQVRKHADRFGNDLWQLRDHVSLVVAAVDQLKRDLDELKRDQRGSVKGQQPGGTADTAPLPETPKQPLPLPVIPPSNPDTTALGEHNFADCATAVAAAREAHGKGDKQKAKAAYEAAIKLFRTPDEEREVWRLGREIGPDIY